MPELQDVSDSEEEDFFDSDSKCSDMPDLESISDSEDEVEEDEEGEDANEEGNAAAPPETRPFHVHMEMYDSRCTRHLTPYKDKIEMYHDILPQYFSAVNQQILVLSGRGRWLLRYLMVMVCRSCGLLRCFTLPR